MAQVIERSTDETVVDEYDAIRLDGDATGDVEKLRAALHPDARMFGRS